MIKKIFTLILDLTQTITVSLSILVMVYLFIGKPTQVLGYSMEPNLEPNQWLIVQNAQFTKPDRGEIVVLHSPTDFGIDYVKRIVGLPNETLLIKNCKIFLIFDSNLESELSEPYLSTDTCTKSGSAWVENQPYHIPDDHYLVLGDNREHSYDGRFFGAVPKNAIFGVAKFSLWPWGRMENNN